MSGIFYLAVQSLVIYVITNFPPPHKQQWDFSLRKAPGAPLKASLLNFPAYPNSSNWALSVSEELLSVRMIREPQDDTCSKTVSVFVVFLKHMLREKSYPHDYLTESMIFKNMVFRIKFSLYDVILL